MMQDNKPTIAFIKSCLKSEGYSRELIAYLFSTYDLDTFISTTNKNKLELASHFLGHARTVDRTAREF